MFHEEGLDEFIIQDLGTLPGEKKVSVPQQLSSA